MKLSESHLVVILSFLFAPFVSALNLPVEAHFDEESQLANMPLNQGDVWNTLLANGDASLMVTQGSALNSYHSPSAPQALEIKDNSDSANVLLRTNGLREGNGSLGARRLKYHVSVLPKQEDGELVFSGRTSSGNKAYFKLVFASDGTIQWVDGSHNSSGSGPLVLGDYQVDQYNHVELLIDIVSQRMIASVNGSDIAVLETISSLDASVGTIDILQIESSANAIGTYYLDALVIEQIPPLPASSLPIGDYYVNAETGSDTNPGTQAQPWRSIWKINNTVFSEGSEIVFQRGQRWLESLDVPFYTGNSGTTLTIRASDIDHTQSIESQPRPQIGYLLDITDGFEILKNTSFEQAIDINISGSFSHDYIEDWKVDGVAHVKEDAGGHDKFLKLNAGTAISQDIILGIGGADIDVTLEVENLTTQDNPVQLQLIRKHPEGQIFYLKTNGSDWSITPSYLLSKTLDPSQKSTLSAVIKATNRDLQSANTAWQYELKIIAAGNAIQIDDVSMMARWLHNNSVHQLNIGSMSENLIAVPLNGDLSSGEVMLRDRRIDFNADLTDVEDLMMSMKSFMLYVKDSGYSAQSGFSKKIYAPYLEYSTLVKGKKHVVIESLDISGGRFGRSYAANSLINFEDWEWYSRFKTAGGGLILLNNETVTVKDTLVHDNGGANITTVTYESGDTSQIASDTVHILDSHVYRAGSEGMRLQAHNIKVAGNRVFDNALNVWSTDTNGIGAYSGSGTGSAGVLIERNNVYQNGAAIDLIAHNIVDARDTAIAAYNVSNVTIRDNYVHDNYNGGIYSHGGTQGAVAGTKILNNIVYNNGLALPGPVSRQGISIKLLDNSEVTNNIVVGNNVENDGGIEAGLIVYDYVSNTIVANNIVSDNNNATTQIFIDPASSVTDESNIDVDPQLRNPGMGLFSPEPWSPAYDGGEDVSHLSDAIGQQRKIGLKTDVGAYEQVVVNAGFESSQGLLHGWTRNWTGGTYQALSSAGGPDMAAHGDAALNMTIASGNFIILHQDLDMPASNNTYTLRFWCKNPIGELGLYIKNIDSGQNLTLTNQQTTTAGTYLRDFSCEGNGSEWREQQVTLHLGEHGLPDDGYRLVFYNYGKTQADFSLDDVSLSLELSKLLN